MRAKILAVFTLLATCWANGASLAPAAPSNLTATSPSQSQINLKWQDNSSNEQGFIIQRSLSSTTGFIQIANILSGTTSFQDSAISPATTYYYRIAAYNKIRGRTATSNFSNVASSTTAAQTTTTTTTQPPVTTTTTLQTATTTTTTTQPPTQNTAAGAPADVIPPAPITVPSTMLPIPTNIANGTTVSLQCGQVYSGTLNLDGKSNITVTVAGTCGKPTIIPPAGKDGISAINASSIQIENVKVQSAYRGINANNAKTVRIFQTDVINSSNNGIEVSGVVSLTVDRSTISNSGKSGIGGWAPSYSSVTNSVVSGAGNPTVNYSSMGVYDAGQGLALDGMTNKIDHNTVTKSSYFGIVAGTAGSFVTNNLVDQVCIGPDSDCGGIYIQGRDQTKHLDLLIQNNVVRNVQGVGIYLDNESAYVTVDHNSVTNTQWSLLVNSGVADVITNNTFTTASKGHIALNQFAGISNHDLRISQNIFKSTNGENCYNLMGIDMKTFGTYDYNTYSSPNPNSFARMWDATSNPGFNLSYSGWKSYMTGQDTHSTMNGQP